MSQPNGSRPVSKQKAAPLAAPSFSGVAQQVALHVRFASFYITCSSRLLTGSFACSQ